MFLVNWRTGNVLPGDGISRDRRSFDQYEPELSFEDFDISDRSLEGPPAHGPPLSPTPGGPDRLVDTSQCRMDNCFDMANCRTYGFTVYIYPPKDDYGPLSKNYQKVLDSIRRSPYYTNDASKACIKGF